MLGSRIKKKTGTVTTYIPGEWISHVSMWCHCLNIQEACVSGLLFLEVVSPPLADLLLLLLRLVPSALDLWFGPRRRA